MPIRIINVRPVELLLNKNSLMGYAHELDVETSSDEFNSINVIENSSTVSKGENEEEILESLKLNEESIKDLEASEKEKMVKLRELICEFIDIFRSSSQLLTKTTGVKHRIILEDDRPVALRPYRIPFQRQACVCSKLCV